MNLIWRALSLCLAGLLSSAGAGAYTVKPGDTMYSLARAAGLSVAQLQTLNGLSSAELKVGQVLQLPDPVNALPAPPTLFVRPAVAMTRPGCCANPSWSADGEQLLFLDRPPGLETGVYSVPVGTTAALGALEVWRFPPTLLSPDGRYGLQPTDVTSALATRLADQMAAGVPTSGRNAVWSAAGLLAWPTYGTAQRDDWIPMTVFQTAPFAAGTPEVHRLVTVYGGQVVGWLNETTLLLTGRGARTDDRRAVLSLNVTTGQLRSLAQGTQLSGVQISPDGQRAVYRVTLDTPGRNGMFILDVADGTFRPLGVFGSARWQDAAHLLTIPFAPGDAAHRLIRVDVTTGTAVDLVSLDDQVATDDWHVSPDGSRIAYLSALDHTLEVLTLPINPSDPGQEAP